MENELFQSNLGFYNRSFITAILPHSKVKGDSISYQTEKYSVDLSVSPIVKGLPYGIYPRLILFWLISEIVKKKKRTIDLGDNLTGFMRSVGVVATGGQNGTIQRFKQQLQKILTMIVRITSSENGNWKNVNFAIADKSYIMWEENKSQNNIKFNSQVLISEMFYEHVLTNPIPVKVEDIRQLKNSSLALDIFFWLTYRIYYSKETIVLTYEQLFDQFGFNYPKTSQGKSDFKKAFNIQLNSVSKVIKNLKLDQKDNKLYINKTKIKKTLLKDIPFNKENKSRNNDIEELLKSNFNYTLEDIDELYSKHNSEVIEQAVLSVLEWAKINQLRNPNAVLNKAIKEKWKTPSKLFESVNTNTSMPKVSDEIRLNNINIYKENWEKVKHDMRNHYTENIYNNWLEDLKLYNVVNDSGSSQGIAIQLVVSSQYIRDWIINNYLGQIRKFWQHYNANIIAITLVIMANEFINQNELVNQ